MAIVRLLALVLVVWSLQIAATAAATASTLGDDSGGPIYFGFFAAIALVNLMLFVLVRQRSLLLYAITIAAITLALVARNAALIFYAWLFFALNAYFARVFLELADYDPNVDKAILALIAISAVELVGVFPGAPPWYDGVGYLFFLLLTCTILVAGVRAARRDYRAARFFVVGSVGAVACLIARATYADWALIGIAWEALWFTVALADRMNEIARENENIKLSWAELQVLAELDPLTGIPNRRAFDNQLQIGWTRALRAGTSLGVIMIDVDHFKEYNDAEGHVEGDLCLTKIAQACAASMMRNGDFLARYGGEEFGGILVTKTDEDIAVVAERMRVAVAELAIPHPTNPDGIVTISLGVARIRPSTRDNPLELVDAADEALYAAKSRGRNQVGTTLLATT